MDFFKSGLKILGAPEPGQQPTGAETVEKLVDRVNSSTLLDDRRDACRALKALSRKYRIEVGAQGMPAIIQILQTDRADCEIISYALDTLCNVMSPDQFDEEAENPIVSVNVGEQFTEMFIKTNENVTIILGYLEEYDFRVRWSAIKLITILLANKTKELQELVLVSPMGVSKLMDLLIDSREVIRNDALLLLIQLTKGNVNIQKIVAFENAFDHLFDIVKGEGCSDGGIVVEDCLILMLNLLKNNSSNQQFFKEGSFIQKLSPMFVIPPEFEETGWTPQKVSNIHCMLQIVRALTSPNNQQFIISSCQNIMQTCGMLEGLCNILMGSGVPPDILTETINAVAEVVRGDAANQDYLSKVMAPSSPLKPALVVLLMSMVNEKQPLSLRCAVLYCFECFLYRNEIGQDAIVQTLLPSSSSEVSSLTTGQLLCGGLFSLDPLANWCSSVVLMHALVENATQKEQLLRVLLATSTGSQPISLLQQCTALLQKSNCKLQPKIGLLMLLSVWLSNCPLAVNALLSAPGCTAYLIAQISANEHDENEYLVQGLCAFVMGLCIQFNNSSLSNNNRENLCQLVVKRIGKETFATKLGQVSRHESYSRAAKQPQIYTRSGSDLLLDYEFCKMFKSLETVVANIVSSYDVNGSNLAELTLSSEASRIVKQYKDIIRGLDDEINALKKTVTNLEQNNEELTNKHQNLQILHDQLSDRNILYKAQLTAASSGNVESGTPSNTNSNYEAENARLVNEIEDLRTKLKDEVTRSTNYADELATLQKDQHSLLELLNEQDLKLNSYKKLLRDAGIDFEDDDDIEIVEAAEILETLTIPVEMENRELI